MLVRNFSDVHSIEIESTANISIVEGLEFQVKVTGDDVEKVKVVESAGTVTINYSVPSNNNFSFISGNNISIGSIGSINGNVNIGGRGKNISIINRTCEIINGEVFINGKKVEEPDSPNTPTKTPVEIEIQCPNNLSVNCVLSGDATLTSTPEFDEARITLQGSCSAKLSSKSARFKISGCGEVEYKSLGGNLKAHISGSGEIKATGSFNDIDASISGCGELITGGHVKGDYDVSISGTGEVRHQGTIAGHKSKSVSGCGSVRW